MAKKQKPEKPYPDFPLTANGNGQWSKKIKGRVCYFGVWSDPNAALRRYLDERDDLQAGREPASRTADGVTVDELVNRFLGSKKALVDSGELSQLTWHDYRRTAKFLIEAFGREREAATLRPEDFRQLRTLFSQKHGPARLAVDIQHVRIIFRYGFEAELLASPMKMGPDFKRPSQKARRRLRQAAGPKLFSADEVRRLLGEAEPGLRAAILMGVNCALGNTDLAKLTFSKLDLEGGWHNLARPKTGVERRCPLWPETVAALREWIDKRRPQPLDPPDAELVFLTPSGRPLTRIREASQLWVDGIGGRFLDLVIKLELTRGRGFYALRHTFRTVADESLDQVSVNYIMGHSAPVNDMASVYREKISDERLLAVTDYVRKWLFGERKEGG